MRRARALGVGFAAMAAAVTAFVPRPVAAFTPDPKGLTVLKYFVADDARLGIFSTGKALFNYDKLTGPYIKASPQQIEQDYKNNEVSADEKYKGLLIVFSGRINTISKDFLGSPYITVETGDFLSDIHAEMDEDIPTLSKLSKGGKIALVCKGSSYVMTSPILHNCRLQDSYLAAHEHAAADSAAQWLTGGDVPSFLDTPKMRSIAFVLYFMGMRVQHPELCTLDAASSNIDACTKQMKAARLSPAEIKEGVDAAPSELQLGAMSPPVQSAAH